MNPASNTDAISDEVIEVAALRVRADWFDKMLTAVTVERNEALAEVEKSRVIMLRQDLTIEQYERGFVHIAAARAAGYAEGVAKVKAAVEIQIADAVAFAKDEWVTNDGFVICAVESVLADVSDLIAALAVVEDAS